MAGREWTGSDLKPKATNLKRYKCPICKEYYRLSSEDYNRKKAKSCSSVDCMTKAGINYISKASLQKKKEQRKEIKEKKEANKSIATLKKDLQIIINQIVRTIDAEYPCIAKPGEATLRFDAGHYFSVGSVPSLRYNMHNIHKESSNNNQWKQDNNAYRLGVAARYGVEYLDYMDSLKQEYKVLKPSTSDLRIWIKAAKEVRKKIKTYGKEMYGLTSIEIRTNINAELGIYK